MRPDRLNALFAETASLKGVGPGLARPLERLSLTRIRDLAYHLPDRFVQRRAVSDLDDASIGENIIVALTPVEYRNSAGRGPFRINAFGHLGDGNLHFNVFPPKGERRDAYLASAGAIKDRVHSLVAARGGSFSAEHGVGRLKVADLQRFGDPARLAAMRAVKAALDPLGIMNPGAVLRSGA